MANDYYSLRSYDHFCFFCQINNSKKKKDEFAFFIFFTFKGESSKRGRDCAATLTLHLCTSGWKRLVVADGPRQVINALTLYALGERVKWSTNVVDYYEGNIFTGIMLLTMIFTVLVFAVSAFMLIIAAIMYIPLICYIKGNLKEYCCHKIDKRIAELVQKKKKQRLAKHAAIARAEAAGDFSHLKNKRGEIIGRKMQQPTLPSVDVDLFGDPKPHGRADSVASSAMPNGGMTEKDGAGFYDQSDQSSNAHLILNAAQPGAGSVAHGGYNSPSLPPTAHNSPDAFPQHVRGIQGANGSLRRAQSPSQDLLAQLGPIGTSPAVFAHAMRGKNAALPGNGSPLAQDAYGQQDPSAFAYADAGVDYPPPPHAGGAQGLEYPPPSAATLVAAEPPPADLSAFAPYDHNARPGPSPAPSYGADELLDMYADDGYATSGASPGQAQSQREWDGQQQQYSHQPQHSGQAQDVWNGQWDQHQQAGYDQQQQYGYDQQQQQQGYDPQGYAQQGGHQYADSQQYGSSQGQQDQYYAQGGQNYQAGYDGHAYSNSAAPHHDDQSYRAR